jgi:LysM repeat protein
MIYHGMKKKTKAIYLQRLTTCLVLWFVMTTPVFAQTYDENVESYISQYKDIAIEEMNRTGIPASITLAQGIIESNAGKSPLATDANNHFGIKCHAGWTGESYTYDDDRKNECFRKYLSALDSYKDHSDFLKNRDRYSVLFTYDAMDYKAWAKGLKSCGYATNPHYANVLIKCVEDYDLHQWDLKEEDRAAYFASLNKQQPVPTIKETGNPEIVNASPTSENAEERIYVFNDIKCVTLQEGESLNDLATSYQIGIKRFLRYNDISNPHQLNAGDRVFLQPKRKNGDTTFHVVAQGETMLAISKLHGIQLQSLYEKNKMLAGMQPATGEIIYLKESTHEPPILYSADADTTVTKIGPPPQQKMVAPRYYTVAKGDTLYSISKRYNVTIGDLKEMNRLKSSDIRVGEKLVVTK